MCATSFLINIVMSIEPRPREDLLKMLDENHHLILQIADLQNKGRASDCHIIQKHLLKNLLYLGTMANEQIKAEEAQSSPTTALNHTSSETPRVATSSSANVTTPLRSSETLLSISQQKAHGVASSGQQETPVPIGVARPRRLSPVVVETPLTSRPTLHVEVPVSSVAGAAAPPPQLSTAGGATSSCTVPVRTTIPFSQRLYCQPLQVSQGTAATLHEGVTSKQISPSGSSVIILQQSPTSLHCQAFPMQVDVPQATGQILQLQSAAPIASAGTAGSVVISSNPGTQPIYGDAGVPSIQSSPVAPMQQYIATMTPQGMVLVPLKPAPS